MRRSFMLMRFGIILAAGANITGVGVMEAHAADEAAPACKTAEVNPVTGHVFCIDPLGRAAAAGRSVQARSRRRGLDVGAELRACG